MPKQDYVGGVLQITEDLNDPQDKLKDLQKKNKGKDTKILTEKEKVDLFNAYVDAGVIQLG